jgi:PD-(D/E)XK nuclease superfamily protein
MPQKTGNEAGERQEAIVSTILGSRGYARIDRNEVAGASDESPWFAPQYNQSGWLSLFNAVMRLDFFLYHPTLWPKGLAIEVKWQASNGSTDRKIVHDVLSLKTVPVPALMILCGGGFKGGCRDWILSQREKRFTVLEGTDTFSIWASANL